MAFPQPNAALSTDRCRGALEARQPVIKALPDRGPVDIQDRELCCVPNSPRPGNLVPSQNAFVPRSQLPDRRLAGRVAGIGDDLDPNRTG